jgi:FtsP/CotA-like multicopper oxidase with cupredoxin domain
MKNTLITNASRRGVLKASVLGGAASLLGSARRANADSTPAQGILREYWIQVDSFPHNLVPTGVDAMSGATYPSNQCSIGALGYRAFSPNWQSPLPGNDDIGPNAGIPGPTIRAKVGDTIRIHFRNNDRHFGFPHSIHAHGVAYDPPSDGAWVAVEPSAGSAVALGDSFTYEYTVLPQSVGTWPYHDHSVPQTLIPGNAPDVELNVQIGMMGVIAITDDNTPPADVENVLVMHDLYADTVPGLAQDFDSFNGFAYLGNTPTFHAQVGQRVRWRVIALGKEFHVFHLHGHRWQSGGRFVDTEIVGPATSLTLDYIEDRPGKWLYHCHVFDHMMGGMVVYYVVG